MAFEVYTPKKRKRREEPKPIVSMSKSSIVLNKVARTILPADRYELAFDRERRVIRLKPSPDGMFVKKTKINARGFFKQFDIDSHGKFTADYRPEEQALFVELPH